MASPASRQQLKDYCLRKLGFPVIDLNLDDDQIDDRIDDALQKFREFHYDGTEETYLAVKVTQPMLNTRKIRVADSIIGITRLLPVTGTSISSGSSQGFNIFDINYQIRLNDFYNLLSSSYTYFVIARQHLAMLDMIVTGEVPFDYNKTTNEINVYMDFGGRLSVNDYIVFQAVRIVDPESYDKVFNSSWMKKYATALIKQQWGSNLTKYANYTLPGGLTVNGEKIYTDAVEEIEKLEAELRDVYEAPPQMIVG